MKEFGIGNLETLEIKEIANDIKDKLIMIRREIHRNPELSYEEYDTSEYIKNILDNLNLEVETKIAKTGIIGLIRGEKKGKTISIRADMDALPIMEENEVDYISRNPGIMHACGHDAHITFVIGAAMILSKMKSKLKGNVKFIFQPAEETIGGAKPMIEKGVLKDPKVEAIIGGHVWGSIDSGKIGIREGAIMASTDMIEIEIIGKGGHAAKPHKTVDPIFIGSQIINSIQSIVSRKTDPLENVVVSICTFHSGDRFNVIPSNAIIKGTIRTLNDEIRKKIPEEIENVVKGITQIYGASYKMKYINRYPVTVNHKSINQLFRKSASKIIGQENIVEIEKPSMGGEDFSYFLKEIPGSFIWIGTRNIDKGIINEIHNPKFDIDEDILPIVSSIYAQCVLDYLNNN